MRDNLTTGFHIGEDICPTEGVNRLFRVANQQQGSVGLLSPDAAKNAVLLGVGVLKFVNHRHRKTGTDRAGERFTILAGQRLVQAAQHVIKPQLAPATFFARDGLADLRHGAGDHQVIER